jgi:hypothetical protein
MADIPRRKVARKWTHRFTFLKERDMNRQDKPSTAANDDDSDAGAQHTPSTDMQPEDAGTADSGNSAPAAEKAMKQTSKTPAERGGKG